LRLADFGIPDKKGLNPLKLASQLKLENHFVQLIETDVKERKLSAEIAWNQAKQSGTSESYDQFMLSHPYSKYYNEARKTWDSLKEEQKVCLELERYNQAKPLTQKEIENLLQAIRDELSPFEIEKLLSKDTPHKRSATLEKEKLEQKLFISLSRFYPRPGD
jgi:hypothetical protein